MTILTRLFPFVVLVSLGGCAHTPGEPIIKTFSARTVEVTWIRSPAGCDGAAACASFKVGGRDACTIRAAEPADWNDEGALEILGHELIHCFYGAGHKRRPPPDSLPPAAFPRARVGLAPR
jgi:hypothetical protein